MMALDDGELDFSNHKMFLGSNVGGIQSSESMNVLLDDIFNDVHACIHTHKRNPPGFSYRVHNKILPTMSDDDKAPTDDTAESSDKKEKNYSKGNREAVKKYRERKKARAASLEDEVVRLRALNQQLMKKIQTHSGLEAEVGRLKYLLVDIRGRIDGELGSFPYQKQVPVNQSVINMRQTTPMQHDQHVDGCDMDLECIGSQESMLNEVTECGAKDGLVTAKRCSVTKKKR
uniref:Basic leucine zipper 23-like n=1 Tax=Tanacetum cinerariifolium TaxID=118510 RepID=A0A6L2NXY2_TANCI|nr:basic leucine zipper 23-like [Tanacetum cinerariifolium]